MLKSVGRACFPVRNQVSSFGFYSGKEWIQSWWWECQGFPWSKPNAPADAARVLHGLHPTQKTNSNTKWQIHISFAEDGLQFVVVLHGTDCITGQDRANFEEPAADGKISSLSKSKSQISNWAHWSGLKRLFFECFGQNTPSTQRHTTDVWKFSKKETN